MLKSKVIFFLEEQLDGLTDFSFTIEEEDKYIYVNFTEIFSEPYNKEMIFKIISDKLQYHSVSFGWKIIDLKKNLKYFWIDLLEK